MTIPVLAPAVAEGCWETTTPEWVFGLTLAAGLVALSAAVSWGTLWKWTHRPSSWTPQPPEASEPLPWWRRALLVGIGILAGVNLYQDRDMWARPPDAAIIGAILVLAIVYPLSGLTLFERRARRSRRLEDVRRAPLGMFWVLPVIFLSAVGAGAWSIWAQIASSRPC